MKYHAYVYFCLLVVDVTLLTLKVDILLILVLNKTKRIHVLNDNLLFLLFFFYSFAIVFSKRYVVKHK